MRLHRRNPLESPRGGHVNQVLQYSQRNALSHVHRCAPRRVPPASDAAGALAIQTSASGPANTGYAPSHQDGMLCSIRVRVRSTNAMPSLLTSNSAGVRSPRIPKGVDSQCVAFCSSPKTATAWAITGTRRATTAGDVTILILRGIAGPGFLDC